MSASYARVTAFLASVLCLQWTVPALSADLDLGSTDRQVVAGLHGVIKVGGTRKNVAAGDLVTAAESVALYQVFHQGKQSLVLSDLGNAVGGKFTISDDLGLAGNIVIPVKVTAFQTASNLNLVGSLTNSGKLYALPDSSTAYLSALNIFNQQTGVITTVASGSGVTTTSPINLALTAVYDIVNAGKIISGGDLTLRAGGSIINALPAGVTGAAPVMQAMNNISFFTGTGNELGNLVNSGVISSTNGNIYMASQVASNIVVNNVLGRMEALGSINVRDVLFSDKFNTTLWGGDFASENLNIYSGTGDILVDAQAITGQVNAYGHTAHLTAQTDVLSIGEIQLNGDPTFYNTLGSVVLNSDLSFPGQHLAIIAFGDITANGIQILNTSSNNSGGDITLIAGALLQTSGSQQSVIPPQPGDTTSLVTVKGLAPGGGKIDLGTVPISALSSVGGTGSGGDITMVAFGGTNANSGRIILPNNLTIATGSGGTDFNGDVTILSGAQSGVGIQLGSINTTGSTRVSGNIYMLTNQPTMQGCPTCIGKVEFVDGQIVNGTFNTSPNRVPQNTTASISTKDLIAAGTIDLKAGGNIVTGNIESRGVGRANGGSVSLAANFLPGSSDPFTIGAATTNGINGNVLVNGGSSGGGVIGISSGSTGGISVAAASNLTINSLGASQLGLNATGGSLTAPGNWNVSATGANATGGLLNLAGFSAVNFTSAVDIHSDGRGFGSGGNINISGGTLTMPGTAVITANAPTGGSGGSIQVHGTNVTLNTSDFQAKSINGNGGFVRVIADNNLTTGAGTVSLDGSSQSGFGGGGLVSAVNANVGTGAVSINGSSQTGSGGSAQWLTQTTTSAGGAINIKTNTQSGDGGVVVWRSNTLQLQSGGLNIDSSSTADGYGGLVRFDAGDITANNGKINVTTDSTWGFGEVDAFINSYSGANNLSMSARATDSLESGLGGGGTIVLTGRSTNSSVDVGNGANQVTMIATAASAGSDTIDGGWVQVYMGGNLNIDGSGIDIRTLSSNGNGGLLDLNAGNFGQGILQARGNLNADGVGSGAAGTVLMTYADIHPFNSVDNSGSLVTNVANITANSNTGTPGSITIFNNNTAQALGVTNNGLMSAVSATGVKGTINMNSRGVTSSPFQDVTVNGAGSFAGIVNALGKNVTIGLSSNSALEVGTIRGVTGNVTVLLPSGTINLSGPAAVLRSAGVTTVSASNINNNSTIIGTSAVNISNTGNVTLGGTGTLQGPTVEISSSTGSVLAQQNKITGTLTGTSAKDWSVVVNTGGVTASHITANQGSISLVVNGGSLSLQDSAVITANEGNVLLQNNSGTGSIVFNPNVIVSALATDSSTFGQVYVVMGSVPGAPVPGPTPANMTVATLNGGSVFFGTNGISTGCCNHTATADGATIVFDTGSLGAGAIQLTTGDSINAISKPTTVAGPPLPPGHGGTPPGQGGAPPGLGGVLPPGLGGTPPGQGGTPPGLAMHQLDFPPPGQQSATTATINTSTVVNSAASNSSSLSPGQSENSNAGGSGKGKKSAYLENHESAFVPVAFVQPAAVAGGAALLHWTKTATALIKHSGSVELDSNGSNVLALRNGEILIQTTADTVLKGSRADITLKKGTIVLVSQREQALKLRVLYDEGHDSIQALPHNSGSAVSLTAGHELILAAKSLHDDPTGRRRVLTTKLDDGTHVMTSEFSLVSLVGNSQVLSTMASSALKEDRKICDRIMKMGVCLMHATSSHGAYTRK